MKARSLLLLGALVGCAPKFPPPRADAAPAADAAPDAHAAPDAAPDAAPAADAAAAADAAPDAGPPDPCTSGIHQDPHAQESEEMQPGTACIACHVDENATSGEGDAPVFTFAGTVYPTLHEPDLCEGLAALGAEVRVSDASGRTFVAPVNAAGNFMVDDPASLVAPFTATVRAGGGERENTMEHTLADGDCNRCHSAAGAEDAPGRITLPAR